MKQLLSLQIVRYLIVGCTNIVVDVAVLNLMYLVFHLSLSWSVFIGFLCGATIGYLGHSRWTFKYDTKGKEMGKLLHFLAISSVSLALTEFFVDLLTNHFGLYYNFSKLIALALATTWAYSATKWWVFRSHSGAA